MSCINKKSKFGVSNFNGSELFEEILISVKVVNLIELLLHFNIGLLRCCQLHFCLMTLCQKFQVIIIQKSNHFDIVENISEVLNNSFSFSGWDCS